MTEEEQQEAVEALAADVESICQASYAAGWIEGFEYRVWAYLVGEGSLNEHDPAWLREAVQETRQDAMKYRGWVTDDAVLLPANGSTTPRARSFGTHLSPVSNPS